MAEFYTYPISDSAMGDWSGSYADVDEVQDELDTPDDGTTEITASGGLSDAVFNLADHTTEVGIITNVRVYMRINRGGNSGPDAQPVLNIGTTTEYGTSHEAQASWETWFDDWATNPDTSGPWKWDAIDSLKAGVRGQGGSGTREVNCSTVWIVVTYKDIGAGRSHVDDYRDDHENVIHGEFPPLDHESYVLGLLSDLATLTFNDFNEFFDDNDTVRAQEISYDTWQEYYDDCYDENGDVINGKQGTIDSYKGKWH